MISNEEKLSMKKIVSETLLLLCKNGFPFQSSFSLEALVGITLDNSDVVLFSVQESLDGNYELSDKSAEGNETSSSAVSKNQPNSSNASESLTTSDCHKAKSNTLRNESTELVSLGSVHNNASETTTVALPSSISKNDQSKRKEPAEIKTELHSGFENDSTAGRYVGTSNNARESSSVCSESRLKDCETRASNSKVSQIGTANSNTEKQSQLKIKKEDTNLKSASNQSLQNVKIEDVSKSVSQTGSELNSEYSRVGTSASYNVRNPRDDVINDDYDDDDDDCMIMGDDEGNAADYDQLGEMSQQYGEEGEYGNEEYGEGDWVAYGDGYSGYGDGFEDQTEGGAQYSSEDLGYPGSEASMKGQYAKFSGGRQTSTRGVRRGGVQNRTSNRPRGGMSMPRQHLPQIPSAQIGDEGMEMVTDQVMSEIMNQVVVQQVLHCPMCDAQFTRRGNLTHHVNVLHLRKKRYECEHCGRTFKWHSGLGQHRRTCPPQMQ